jgi:UDP-glucuronate 4-epimerase
MRILVTGAAGFIGSHTAERLLDMGHTVVGVDNFSDYYNPAFKRGNIEPVSNHTSYRIIEADVTDIDAMRKVFADHQIEKVVHLAAQAGVRVSIQKPMLCQKVNVEGTYAILELAHEFGIDHVVYASSSSVYGNQEKTPFSEDDLVDNPISPYAASKKACELIAYTYHHLYKMHTTGLRFFTVYGERGRPDMSPYLFADAILHDRPISRFGDGSMERDFTYIDDIVSGIVACVERKLGYQVINLGNAHPVTLNEYIATFERVTGKKAIIDQKPMQPGDVRRTAADNRKAKELLGWEPTTSLEAGLTKFIHWFEQNRM